MPSTGNIDNTKESKLSDFKREYKFFFDGEEYDCTDYAKKHPAGEEFFWKQAAETNDLTSYFSALHSETAHKIIKSLPKTGRKQKIDPNVALYQHLHEKVKHLYPNNYVKDFLWFAFVTINFLLGCFAENKILAFICIINAQIVSGWICHSWAHGRDAFLYKFVNWYSPLVAGVSTRWWNRKHNLHHMFTNVFGKDEDIQHSYTRVLFGFLYLKWNFDSIMFDYKTKRVIPLILHFIFYFQQNIIIFLLAQYVAGFFSAHILIGNHEKEKNFEGKHGLDFIRHQLVTARDYDYHGLIWLCYMGGKQLDDLQQEIKDQDQKPGRHNGEEQIVEILYRNEND
ncbi:Cytochrome b5-like heme/steroid binding domain [Pseudocohnilembus persalinus]|uniref:Cytochrome b5-like heme/steroid binding domain n=1 Tax=Pseudocohnilembus persalinus TaxID=266149 RepID=A0A0V0QTS6_PSEPJ|nr:Cytochrome b5-like heme/steroid binding domain [Pseudocohnilembus persalinus]|eukprot:KRX05652.1 Cytochrome b5-like heme/steroid binding domain [Pseudocohnilembus persalinus]